MNNRWILNLVTKCFFLPQIIAGLQLGKDSIISPRARLLGGAHMVIGSRVRIHDNACIDAREGSVGIGDDCVVGSYSRIVAAGGFVSMGNQTTINPFSVAYGQGGLTIGNGVRIAAHSVLIPQNHGFDNLDMPIYLQKKSQQGITVGDNVWIGANSVVLDGVVIETGAVIGAGSVVTHRVLSNTIVAGNPARKLRDRGNKIT